LGDFEGMGERVRVNVVEKYDSLGDFEGMEK
jgi:hypothetical protein